MNPRTRRLAVNAGIPAIVVLVLLLGYLVLRGGGSPASTSATSPTSTTIAVSGVYLSTGADYVAELDWTDNGGALTGTAHAVRLNGIPPSQASTDTTLQVSGTVHDATLSVSFNGGPPATGAVNGSNLVLDFPAEASGMTPVTFHPATATDFTAAVQSLQATVTQANGLAQQRQTATNQQQAVAIDVAAVNQDLTTLGTTNGALKTALAAVPPAVSPQSALLSKTKSAHDSTVAEAKKYPDGNNGQVCRDAATVVSDAAAVQAQAGSVATTVAAVVPTLTAARAATAAIQKAYAQLQVDLTKLPPSAAASGVPAADVVTKAETTVSSTITNGVTATNALVDKSNGNVDAAYGYANDANAAGHCGSAQSVPAPVNHVS